jgi:hypothetical protein
MRLFMIFGAVVSGLPFLARIASAEVPSEVDGIPLVGLSAPVLLGIFFLMFMRGDIVPRKTYQDMMTDRDFWRQAHKESEDARRTSSKQVDTLIEGFKTVDAIAEGIRSAAGRSN